jgi:toxin ParE1/3/4
LSRLKIVLSREADQDLKDILQYTLATWGAAQMDVYAAAIDKGLKLLVDNPRLGRARNDLFPGCRSFQVEQHTIFYRVDALVLRIGRILHQRMNTKRHVKAID